jgi:hypothetical protein
VGEEEPGTEDGLGEDVEDGVGNDLLVNVHVAGAISDTPNTVKSVSNSFSVEFIAIKLTWGRQSR